MLREILKALLRVLAGTIFLLVLAATIGIPADKRSPEAARLPGTPKELDLQGFEQHYVAPGDVPRWLPLTAQR